VEGGPDAGDPMSSESFFATASPSSSFLLAEFTRQLDRWTQTRSIDIEDCCYICVFFGVSWSSKAPWRARKWNGDGGRVRIHWSVSF
jgi:hypothetical protein